MYGFLHESQKHLTYVYDLVRYACIHKNSHLKDKSFSINDRRYNYMVHPYNHTWRNERAVEIPIIYDLVKKEKPEEILEIGNVLSHYFASNHDVLDLYERSFSKKIINEDITTYQSPKKYQLIISISTLEHVGWDEHPQDPPKVLLAFSSIKQMLAPGGKAVITLPVGHNSFLDDHIAKNALDISEIFCLKRITQSNEWETIDLAAGLTCSYNHPYPKANAVVVLVMEH